MASKTLSAVIILIELSSNSIILTKRSPHLRDHPGEICFPGGRWQAGDGDLWETALRELNEELGINANRVNFIQKLSLAKTLKGSAIQPWLASIEILKPYAVNSNEVSQIVSLPLKEVLKVENYKSITVNTPLGVISNCQYTASPHFIWGATVRIMKQLMNADRCI